MTVLASWDGCGWYTTPAASRALFLRLQAKKMQQSTRTTNALPRPIYVYVLWLLAAFTVSVKIHRQGDCNGTEDSNQQSSNS